MAQLQQFKYHLDRGGTSIVCEDCGALVEFTDASTEAHSLFHEKLEEAARAAFWSRAKIR
ncbi:MAG TPA: hypothetical protein VFI41_05040 [Gemmatimonadales bacterium]|nr:hypothetical protein [Gemmatimonadales bacterium]